jgi:hypothetical protein
MIVGFNYSITKFPNYQIKYKVGALERAEERRA